MSRLRWLLLWAALFTMSTLVAAPRGLKIVVSDPAGAPVAEFKGSYALVIGASDYRQGWSDLPGVRKDLVSIRESLERQGFAVTVVEDPDRDGLRDAYERFIDRYGQVEENRLLFYFAGHGHTETMSWGGQMGYVVPVDAPDPQRDPAGFRSKALDMQQMEVYAKRIQSRHALFIFDSCFSGSVFSVTRASPPRNISEKTALPVRQFITSGRADEEVPDTSLFRTLFVRALEGEGDLNRDGYVTATELGLQLREWVINYSHGSQQPQYGKIRDPNLDRGDFVFLAVGEKMPSVGTSAATLPISLPLSTVDAHDSDEPESKDLKPASASVSPQMGSLVRFGSVYENSGRSTLVRLSPNTATQRTCVRSGIAGNGMPGFFINVKTNELQFCEDRPEDSLPLRVVGPTHVDDGGRLFVKVRDKYGVEWFLSYHGYRNPEYRGTVEGYADLMPVTAVPQAEGYR